MGKTFVEGQSVTFVDNKSFLRFFVWREFGDFWVCGEYTDWINFKIEICGGEALVFDPADDETFILNKNVLGEIAIAVKKLEITNLEDGK